MLYHIEKDVFAIVLDEKQETIRSFVENMQSVISRRESLFVHFHIGVANGGESIFDDANMALMNSKKARGGHEYGPCYFTPQDKEARAQKKRDTEILENSINHRNTEYSIEPYYQAKVDKNGHVV